MYHLVKVINVIVYTLIRVYKISKVILSNKKHYFTLKGI